ncbi:MAG: biotin-dependent carboxyltransferase family protein [Gemmatimonadota bacterium]|nr:biotin-dependent carboxyltransferase family protein [Gemmatimonadota bacterium]
MITISRAPAWLVVQDLGWQGHRAVGMPVGGAMDRHALAAANLLAGNRPEAAGLEWALGGGTIRFEEPTAFALGGASVEATLGGRPVAMYTAYRADARDELVVNRQQAGVFTYVAVQGGVHVEPVLGSRSTYVMGGFGGLHGRRMRAEDFLPLGTPQGAPPPEGFMAPPELVSSAEGRPIRTTPGPQAGRFPIAETDRFFSEEWLVAAASDRMGYRLKGPPIASEAGGTLASEPACPGAVQVPAEGGPIVLMADGPTVGGYPKLAIVCGADLGRLAQCQPGRSVQFCSVSIGEGQRLYRRRAVQLHTLASLISGAPGS